MGGVHLISLQNAVSEREYFKYHILLFMRVLTRKWEVELNA